jgi:hypothetical protein
MQLKKAQTEWGMGWGRLFARRQQRVDLYALRTRELDFCCWLGLLLLSIYIF